MLSVPLLSKQVNIQRCAEILLIVSYIGIKHVITKYSPASPSMEMDPISNITRMWVVPLGYAKFWHVSFNDQVNTVYYE